MASPMKKSRSGAKRRVMPNQGIGKASSRTNPAARAGQRKAAPARSNAGGALRGQARAAAVKTMNAAKRKTPISVTRSGKKTSITGSRSVAAQSIRRGLSKPKAASAGAPSATRGPAQLQDYAGNPGEFLKDFFTGGALRKR